MALTIIDPYLVYNYIMQFECISIVYTNVIVTLVMHVLCCKLYIMYASSAD